jgi:hypothetical protein
MALRWAVAVFFGSASLYAQVSMPVGIVRGNLVSWNGSIRSGDFTIRNPQNTVYGCSYDAHTYFERDHHSVPVSKLDAGDPLEVIADRKLGSVSCYARIVQVIDVQAQQLAARRRPAQVQRQAERSAALFTPQGNLTFGGMVLRSDSRTLTLKTRTGEVILGLRPDTRYVGRGLRLDPSDMSVNSHVFVRGGRDTDGHLEAYQVMWGEILNPR